MSSYLKEIEKEENPNFESLALTGMDSLLKGMEKHGDLLIRIDERTGMLKDISSKITYISAILSVLTAFIIAVGIWIITNL